MLTSAILLYEIYYENIIISFSNLSPILLEQN